MGDSGYYIRILLFTLFLLAQGCSEDSISEPPVSQNPKDPQPEVSGDEIVLDFNSTYQTMHHFGASDAWSTEVIGRNWPEPQKDQIAEFLFSKEIGSTGNPTGIGLSMWRNNIGSGSADQVDNGFVNGAWHKSTECVLQADGSYDWSKQEGSRWFLSKAKQYGVEYITGWVASPPYFLTKNGYSFRTPGVSGYNLPEENYSQFAAYLAAYIDHNAQLGIPIDYVSLINEPQWAWEYEVGSAPQEGSYCSNEEAQNLAETVNDHFLENDISSKIIMPESADLEFMFSNKSGYPSSSNQVNAFWNSGSSNFLGDFPTVERIIAGHSYWSNSSVENAVANRFALKSALSNNNVAFWQTEYSILGGDYLQGGNAADLKEMDYSLWLARIMHWDITLADATGWSFWTALSRAQCCDHRYRFGLLNWYPDGESRTSSSGRIETTKNLWAFGNFSRFVRPGMQRFKVENKAFQSEIEASKNFMVSGYINQSANEVVLVCINFGSSLREIYLSGYGESFNLSDDAFIAYTTSATKNLSKTDMLVDEIKIPAKSIVTLTGKLTD